jgi:hypothetical protein
MVKLKLKYIGLMVKSMKDAGTRISLMEKEQ